MRKFQKGTPEFGLLLGVLGAIIAAMILFFGFWRTVLVVVLFAIGYFVGAVDNKAEFFKQLINRFFPSKDE
ncbi:MAG: DUF2273 domain-containing protein [Clostridia bacterium]|nr:DUF2273 domain-containing protein [Clostridia bacterium]